MLGIRALGPDVDFSAEDFRLASDIASAAGRLHTAILNAKDYGLRVELAIDEKSGAVIFQVLRPITAK